MFVAYMLLHYFCFVEFKSIFEFNCLNPFIKNTKLFPFAVCSRPKLQILVVPSELLRRFARHHHAEHPVELPTRSSPAAAHRLPHLLCSPVGLTVQLSQPSSPSARGHRQADPNRHPTSASHRAKLESDLDAPPRACAAPRIGPHTKATSLAI
jgi:hypothetical protein